MSDPVLRQARYMRAGAVIAPVLAVVFIRFVGPQQALAMGGDAMFNAPGLPSLLTSAPEPEGVLATAATYARHLYEAGISGTPFPTQVTQLDGGDTPRDSGMTPSQLSAQSSGEIPSLRISAIMSRRAGAIAVIDSRIRTVGARVAPGWILDSIDDQNRTLVIRSSTGQRVELMLSTP